MIVALRKDVIAYGNRQYCIFEEMSAAALTVAMLPYLSCEYEKAYNTADPLEIAVRIYNDILDRFSGVNSQK